MPVADLNFASIGPIEDVIQEKSAFIIATRMGETRLDF
jgi:hypothetical protein